ncbi:MAG: hypothetical protein E7222_05660 [Clostridiales bacterium]|jgi:cell division protein FtsW (lipid II flippase)|nr:hypothetical protein [Clostridiales bacterium]
MSSVNEKKNFCKAGEYVKKVCEQIRWQKAHKVIAEELLDHIQDQKEAFIRRGQKEEEAEQNAVLEMGDAVTVGLQMDQTHRPKPDWGIIIIMSICIIMGLIIQFITSHCSGLDSGYAYAGAFENSLTVLPIAIAVFLIMYFIADYTLIVRSPAFYFFLILSANIFNTSPTTPQMNMLLSPIGYIAMVLVPLYAAIAYNYRNKGYGALIKLGIIACVAIVVFLWRNSYMSCLVFAVSGIIILTVATARNWFSVEKWKALLLIYAPSTMAFAYILFGRQANISLRGQGIFLMQFMEETNGENYMAFLIKECLKNAKILGEGTAFYTNSGNSSLGTSIQAVLPCWWSDYSLIYITYRFGYVCAALLIAAACFLLIRMLLITRRQTSELGFIICLSVTTVLFIQAGFYILSNLGMIRAVAGPLPLITYGRASLVVNMYLMGIFASANRNRTIVNDIQVKKISNTLFQKEEAFIRKYLFSYKK